MSSDSRMEIGDVTLRVDSLRERLAAPELAEARRLLAAGGIASVVSFARSALDRAETTRARFEILSRDLEKHPAEREALIEAYLRETVTEKRALAADLRARRKSSGELVDLATLAERVASAIADAERTVEASLALVRAAVSEGHAPPTDLGAVMELARTPGRWSRRVEALGLLSDVASHGVTAEMFTEISKLGRVLAVRTEHRWVQPAALAMLAVIDTESAIAIARERLADPQDGDDFLVRERIVELASRTLLGPAGWESVVAFAIADVSDHVRITTARAERDPARLARIATSDASPKVRASALIGLASRNAAAAEPCLVAALEDDVTDLVSRTAAEELCAIARRDRVRDRPEVISALARASARADLSPAVRAAIADALAEVSVHCDPIARAAWDLLGPVVADTPVGGHTEVLDPLLPSLDDARLGRVLAVLAREDYALGVDRVDGGLILHRGEQRTFAGWRALFELTHPSPSKRQAFTHTWGRSPAGALRAPPGGLAELTATRVPGERVIVERSGGWGRHLPLIDDLISTGVFRSRAVSLVGSTGTTMLQPAASLLGRMRGWMTMTMRYAELAELRRRALDSDEPTTQVAFVNEVARATGISVQFAPHTFNAGGEVRVAAASPRGLSPRALTKVVPQLGKIAPKPAEAPSPPMALSIFAPAVAGAGSLLDRFDGVRDTFRELTHYATSPHGNRLPHLAAYAAIVLGAMLVRGVAIKRSIENDRNDIPLVIGGWGTRGKSGTERLKAALFQGLGHECLVKTTGCEAMFIHAVPGTQAREIFIYRPYDKATVWEQRDVLALARRLGVRVFLWECMALQPDLVSLLQSQWMRDDYSTITNAYPDHEDVQGPTGYDVATVISEFVPTKGNLLTSEEQMLPLLRERAKERDTTMRVVTPREADLIADDMLKRFPYAEHPKNIALVTSLARALGIPSAVALAEIADNVVPDLGVLKDYAPVPHRGRTLSFTNGMSANERTGALSNWERSKFHLHDPDADPARWVATVVNNRGDRVARSEVFARFLVEDIAAHRHFLIGTNVVGLVGFIHEAMDRHLAAISPTHDLAGDGTERLHTARARLDRAFAQLKIGRTDAESVLHELDALGAKALDGALLEKLLEPAEPGESYATAKSIVYGALPTSPTSVDEELRPFVVATIARRRTVRAVHAVLGRDLGTNPIAIDRAFASAYRALFEETLVVLDDATLNGDQILDAIAKNVPPGARATIMGVQNIKGTGLDFVYRWVSIDTVSKLLDQLASPLREKREEALRGLALHGDYGLLDAQLALGRVTAAQEADPHRTVLPYEVAIGRLRDAVESRKKKLVTKRSKSASESIRAFIGKTFDYLDATRRRRMAGDLLEALVTGRISHASAAQRMRAIVARAQGAWMQAAAT